ncbi:MAG TPA: TetR/AcrR family transcriptional regulator [Candidatus Avibacteroides excrementipullorum]|nr:TetR/AcrR family transcriptional regulator [Candidatus Avibacteroides excrementipullorum]
MDNIEQTIINTAKQLFIEKGYTDTSMSDIASRAGINRSTLHYYFRTKDRMFQAVFGSIVSAFFPKATAIILDSDTPYMERISKILDEYMDFLIQNPSLPKFVCEEINRDVDNLIDSARFIGLDRLMMQAKNTLIREMEAGNLNKVDPQIVFMTFYSMMLYPFLAKNMLITLFLDKEENFQPLMQKWKSHIISQMKMMLCPMS